MSLKTLQCNKLVNNLKGAVHQFYTRLLNLSQEKKNFRLKLGPDQYWMFGADANTDIWEF